MEKIKCNCYTEEKNIEYFTSPFTGRVSQLERTIGRCNGTKERYACSCDGDRKRCDFYEHIREVARSEELGEADKIELEFYRYYVLKHDLLFEVSREYNEYIAEEKYYKNKKES